MSRLVLILVLGCFFAHAAIPEAERQALSDLYHAADGVGRHFGSWVDETGQFLPSGTEGSWDGVVVEDDHVVELELVNHRVAGLIPDSLAQLTHLRLLNLSFNLISGPLPQWLKNLSSLKTLRLGNCSFSGPVPETLPAGLEVISLAENRLEGPIPEGLGQLTNLRELYLLGNKLTGPLPQTITNLEALRIFKAEHNQLSGPLPEDWDRMTALHQINLSGNLLDGPIPQSMGRMPSLEVLEMQDNLLSCVVPDFSQAIGLAALNLSGNRLEGALDAFTGIPFLIELYLNHNRLEGAFPLFASPVLSNIELDGNNLSGSLEHLEEKSGLGFLSMRDNNFSGSLPDLPGGNLYLVDLSGNNFSGAIPEQWTQLIYLNHLDLASNAFTGTVSDVFPRMPGLTHLFLEGNQYDFMPEDWPFSSLQVIDLDNNMLDEDSCPGLVQLRDRGVITNFYQQNNAFFSCGKAAPRHAMPWLNSNRDEWVSDLYIFNDSSQPEQIVLQWSGGERKEVLALFPGELIATTPPRDERGMALETVATSDRLHVGYLTYYRNSESGFSPAQTLAAPIDRAGSGLVFPYLSGDGIPAISLAAPSAAGESPITISLYGSAGVLADTVITLTDHAPQAFTLAELFPDLELPRDLMIVAAGSRDGILTGAGFSFNSALDPSMSRALSLPHEEQNAWNLPWIVDNEQWAGRVAIANTRDQAVSLTLTAIDREGVSASTEATVAPLSVQAFDPNDLFPQMSGYSLQLESTGPITASFQVFHRGKTPYPPAQTIAVPVDDLTDRLLFNCLNGRDLPAIVIQAPQGQGTEEVELSIADYLDMEIETITVTLKGSAPLAMMVDDLVSRSGSAITARSLSGTPLAGAAFLFNELREPSMSIAIPLKSQSETAGH